MSRRLVAVAIFLIWLPAVDDARAGKVIDLEAAPTAAAMQPTILRGSAIAPQPAAARASGLQQIEVRAGRRLWLIDRDHRRVVVCERRFGANVGSSFVRCTRGRVPSRLAR